MRPNNRCSSQGGHNGAPRYFVSPARPAAELGRSAKEGETRMAVPKAERLVIEEEVESRSSAVGRASSSLVPKIGRFVE